MRRLSLPVATIALVVGTIAAPVWASGQIYTPDTTQTYDNFTACEAALKAYWEQEKGIATNGKIPYEYGLLSREVQTAGVVRTGDASARYDSELWYHASGKPNRETRMVETSHSYNQYRRSCDGAVMTIKEQSGYTSTTFDKAP